jgi:hypothetical protein
MIASWSEAAAAQASGCGSRGDRDLAGELGGAPSPLAGDELVPAGGARPDDDRLQHAPLADGVGQRRERRFVEMLAWLVGVWVDLVERELAQPGLGRRLVIGIAGTT